MPTNTLVTAVLRRSWLTGTPNSQRVTTSVVSPPTIKMAYLTMAACGVPAFGSSSCLDFPARP